MKNVIVLIFLVLFLGCTIKMPTLPLFNVYEHNLLSSKAEVDSLNDEISKSIARLSFFINNFIQLYKMDSTTIKSQVGVELSPLDHEILSAINKKHYIVKFLYHKNEALKRDVVSDNPTIIYNNLLFFQLPVKGISLKLKLKLNKNIHLTMISLDTTLNKFNIVEDFLKLEYNKNRWELVETHQVNRLLELNKFFQINPLYKNQNKNGKPDLEKKEKLIEKYKEKSESNFDEALELLLKISQLDSSDGYIHYEIARMCHRLGNSNYCILALKKAIKYDYKLARSHNFLGEIYFLKGWFDFAIEEFDKSIKMDSTYVRPRNMKAKIFWYSGDITNAIKILRNAYFENSNPETLYLLATIYFSKSEIGKAKSTLSSAIELEPENMKYKHFWEIINNN
jgi:tetratricopeptide (TPR) repeat protein